MWELQYVIKMSFKMIQNAAFLLNILAYVWIFEIISHLEIPGVGQAGLKTIDYYNGHLLILHREARVVLSYFYMSRK